MFQQSFLEQSHIAAPTATCIDLFSGDSLLVDGEMHTLMGTAKKPQPSRVTRAGDMVDVYRNLNRYELFSIKQRYGDMKGKVSGYAQSVIIKNPTFAVGEKSRQRILTKKSRSVHAYVRGEFLKPPTTHSRLESRNLKSHYSS